MTSKLRPLTGLNRSLGCRAVIVLGTLGAVLSNATRLRAQGEARAEPIHLEYKAPAECPGRSEFVSQLLARTRRVRLAAPEVAARPVQVSIRAEPGGFVGRLKLATEFARRAHREFRGQDCSAVTATLALAVALAFDPDAKLGPLPIAKPTHRRVPKPSAKPKPAAPRFRRESRPEPLRAHPQAPWQHSSWRFGAGIEANLGFGLAPTALLAPRLYAELERQARGPWAFEGRLSLLQAKSGSVSAGPGRARLTWTAARAEACPYRLALGTGASLRPCAFVEAGALHGQGAGVSFPRQSTLLWLAPGVLVRVQQELFGTLVLDLEGGAFAPLNRAKFYFEPASLIYQNPPVGAELGLGVGFLLP